MKKIVSKIDSLIQSNIVLWLMLIGGAILHGILCFGQTIWLDEALTGSYIRMGWGELLAFTTTDVHPPLYYLIVKLGITLFGDHVYVVKLFSYLPFVLMLLLTVVKVRKEYGNRTTFLMLAFLCTTPCIIERNAEMRMYQWAMFFVYAFALWLFVAVKMQARKDWLICLLFGLCAAYTHYYALIAVALLYAFFFFTNIRNKKMVISILQNGVISVVGYLPWLLVFLGQAKTLKETGWWQESGLGFADIYEYVVFPFTEKTGYEALLFLGLLFAVILCLILVKGLEYKLETAAAISTYLLLILLGILVVLFYQPVFIPRFIYPTVGVLLFGMAMVAAKWRTEFICVMGAVLLLFAAKTYNSQLHYQYDEDSVPALHAFMEIIEEDALIVCDQDGVKCIVEYLYPKHEIENDTDVRKEQITDREVYYFVCEDSSLEENRLESLGILEYTHIKEVHLLYHGFDIYKAD